MVLAWSEVLKGAQMESIQKIITWVYDERYKDVFVLVLVYVQSMTQHDTHLV